MTRSACILLQLALALLITGCASVNYDHPKTETRALPAADTTATHLGRLVAEIAASHGEGESGFYPIYGGIDSLALRLLLAERAEHTIDAQYFLIHDDIIGALFVNALLRAANRGVRVRFLLDDILAMGLDPGLAKLDSHPNIEIRIFNPFAYRRARFLEIFRLGRITRRMHNKSFTVDNQVSLVGGRNIAAEYFDARPDEYFSDLDVLAIGPVVPAVSDMFDTYWNYRASVPIEALTTVPDDSEEALASLDEKVRKSFEEPDTHEYAQAVRASVVKYIESDSSEFVWKPYDLVYDSPEKSVGKMADENDYITTQMRTSIGEVKEELVVVTPYFVLLKDDIKWFEELRARGVKVTVLTNGLAANNHASVHSGYMSARKPLIKAGVELYELRASLTTPADKKLPKDVPVSTLHAKTFVVDGKSTFIGSFNWNQRSVNRDTELGIVIHSEKISRGLLDHLDEALHDEAFRVSLNESNNLRWTTYEDGQKVVVKNEPQAGFWKRFGAGFMRIFPIKSQL